MAHSGAMKARKRRDKNASAQPPTLPSAHAVAPTSQALKNTSVPSRSPSVTSRRATSSTAMLPSWSLIAEAATASALNAPWPVK